MDEDYREPDGEYDTLEEAIAVCRGLTEASLEDLYIPGLTAAELVARYQTFGLDPWIMSAQGGVPFSAWKYVEQVAPDFITKHQTYETDSPDPSRHQPV